MIAYRSVTIVRVVITIIVRIARIIVTRCANIFLHASSECSGSHKVTSLAFKIVEIAAHM